MIKRREWLMRAFVHKCDEKGRVLLGSLNAFITPEYISLENLKRFYLSKMPKGEYFVEVFYNFGNRYGQPDKTFNWEVS
jgi:hypothetical protein